MISENLKSYSCFVPVRKNFLDWKKPDTPKGFDWNNYLLSYADACEYSKKGNVGLCFGYGLIGIDVDNDKLLKFLKEVPETYTESTPSGGLHLIFRYNGIAENKNLNLDGLHLGELRANRQYIVISPSEAISKTDGKIKPYKIIKDFAPALIVESMLKKFLENFSSMPSHFIKKNSSPIKPQVGDRSRYDFAKCCELLEKEKLSFVEVCDKMKVFGSTKWKDREDAYRMLTYRAALRRVCA